jgi:type IV pilus assembly protein PilQ
VRLVAVSPGADAVDRTVVIESSEPVAYSVSRPDPLTVLVELRNVNVEGAATRLPTTSLVRRVDFESAVSLDGNPVGRVRLALAHPATHKVRSERNTIRLDFESARTSSPAQAVRRSSPEPATAPPASAPREPTTKITSVRAAIVNGQTVITLAGNGPLVPSAVTEAQDLPPRLVMDFPGITFTVPAQSPATGLVKRIRVAMNQRVPPITRVVLDLQRNTTFTVQRDGNDVSIAFDDAPQKTVAAAPRTAEEAPAATATVARDAETGELIPIFSDLTKAAGTGAMDAMSALKLASATSPTSRPAQPQQARTPQPAAPPKPDTASLTGMQTGEGQKQYTGNPVSLDFQNADLRSVLRTFAEISGLNMVIDPNVQGSVDIVLTDVPWDQALDTILRANNLGYTVDGTIVRIATLPTLQTEQEQRKKLQQAQADAGQLMVRTFTLSYAKAAEVQPLLVKSALSTRGQIQVDPRTNTLILTDLPERLDTAANLISILDRAEPQVEVEARVVQTTREFARAMGVQWGFGGRLTPELGNTLPLTFPNRVIVGGRSGSQGPTDSRAQPADRVPTISNLGVTGEGVSTIGVQLGAVNGAFNLDLALSALERSGKGRVLSTPRLTTQNNVEAEVAQGIQIPIQVVANNTVTVSFKDAVLMLKVTPQITSANTVIMRITIENASPDFTRSVNNIPPIDTQRANTQVQVNDGATTVIGGIFVSQEQTQNQRVPLMHRIPLLGWLFRKDTVSDESRELLIFITPRILRG